MQRQQHEHQPRKHRQSPQRQRRQAKINDTEPREQTTTTYDDDDDDDDGAQNQRRSNGITRARTHTALLDAVRSAGLTVSGSISLYVSQL